MKPSCLNPLLRPLVLASAMLVSFSASQAATYQWSGATSSDWNTASNWPSVNSSTAGVPPVSGNHRINIQNGTVATPTNSAIFNFPSITMTYGGNGMKGLVIGNGNNGNLQISAGTFSTANNTVVATNPNDTFDVIGNGNGAKGALILDGGNYTSGATGLSLGLGGGPSSIFTLSSGNSTATITTLRLNATTATVNLNAGTLIANQIAEVGTWVTSTLNFDGGTLTAGPGAVSSFVSTLRHLYVKAGGATINSNGKDITIVAPLEEEPSSTGGGLTKNGAGILTLASPSTMTGPVTVAAGGLGVKAGTSSWMPSTLTHSGNILNFNLGVFDPANPAVIDVADLTLNTTDITVNISGTSIPVSSEIKILDYGTKSGSGSLKLNIASLPSNMVATLKENTVDGYYYLEVTSPSATAFVWSGDTNTDGSGEWDTTTANWNTNSSTYAPPALVSFPNIADGGIVSIITDVAPITFDISNATGNPYTFEGAGKITGTTGITKSGTGIVKFNGAAHTYSGTLAINSGAVIKQVADAATGNITVAADDVSFVLDGGITDGAGQTLTISGRGSLTTGYFFTGSAVQRGALQAHNGANTWEGNVVLASNSTSTLNRIGVQNGASLTLTGTISENTTGAPLLFRAGNLGDNITLAGAGSYTYTGQTQIFSNGGSIILGSNNKLPTTSNVFFGSSGTTVFDLNGFSQEFAGLAGNAIGVAATILNNGSASSTLTTTSPAESPTEVADYFPALIADGTNTVSFVKNGDGTQIFAANNTYSGGTTINAGRLELQEHQSASGDVNINGGSLKLSYGRTLFSGVNMSIASGAFFYPDGSSQTLGKLEGVGTIDSTYATAGIDTLTVGANDQSSTFGGVIQQSTVRTHALKKIGTGTFTLTGLNTYTGNTTVEDGTLSVAQSNFADASTVTIGAAEASAAVLNLPNPGTDIVTALVIDGVSQPGDGAVYDKDNSGGAITGDGKIQVGTAPVAGYASWATDNNITEGETGDDDKDGTINLVEYALGLDPQASNPAPGSLTGKLLSFSKSSTAVAAGDVTYSIESSTTLAADSWTPVTPDTNDDSTISYTLPSDPGGKIFARLKVVK